MPKDVQCAVLEIDEFPSAAKPDPAPVLDMEQLERAVGLIDAARRPVLYVGGGIVAADASERMIALAEKAGVPTTMRCCR